MNYLPSTVSVERHSA